MERALLFWRSGYYYDDKRKGSFSGDNFSDRVAIYSKIARGMRESQWDKLINDIGEAYEALNKRENPAIEIDLTGDEESDMGGEFVDPSNLADLDEDSDLE